MTTSAHICYEQDCTYRTNRPDHPLCYDHYLDSTNGIISLCPNCQSAYKPIGYSICRDCNRKQRGGGRQSGDQVGGAGWDKAQESRTAPVPSSAVEAVERVRKNMNDYYDDCINHESNTTQYLVEPLLRELGWDTSDPSQVKREYLPEARRRYRRNKRVDIALLRDGKPVAFIEVKNLDRNHQPKYESQLKGYVSNMSSGIAILTNGRFWILNDVVEGVTRPHSTLATLDILSGTADSIAEQLAGVIGKVAITGTNLPTPPASRVARQPRIAPTTEQITVALKEYRTREAQRRRRPAYTILNDAAVTQIAAVKPSDYAELRSVKGVGSTTIKQHGEAILKIVAGR